MRKRRTISRRFACSLLLFFGLGAMSVLPPWQRTSAATLTVTNTNDSGPGSLRQVVMDAGYLDTIEFHPSLAGGTITLASSLTIGESLTIDGSDLNPHVQITGGGSVCDTGSSTCVIKIEAGNGVGIIGVDIVNGTGSGILNQGFLLLAESTISGNGGYYGGGILHSGTEAYIANSTISGNTAYYGGGIFGNNLTLNNTHFIGNTAVTDGGAIYTNGPAEVLFSTFTDNEAGRYGGCLLTTGSNLVEISLSTFAGNQAEDGGCIYISGGSLSVQNSTLYENIALERVGGFGGGINNAGILTMSNSTLAGNSASLFGGAISNSGTLHLSNNILANSAGGGDCYNSGSISTNIHSLIEDGTCSPEYAVDPLLGQLADNGGPTDTMALLPGSPAIDAGDNPACEPTDQRGWGRPIDGDRDGTAVCDIGAYEATLGLYLPLIVR